MASLLSLAGKVAIVTGASSGIGTATSLLLSKLGAKLTLSGRREGNLKATANSCRPFCGEDPLLIVGDVRDEGTRCELINHTVEHFGKIDVLINNAGVLGMGTIGETSLEDLDTVMDINFRSVFHLTALALPHLLKTKGNIVNLSSIAGIRPFPTVLSYCISKAAVEQFTKCISLDLAPKGVRVNAVSPGSIVTEIHKRAGMNEEAYAQFLERCKEVHPLGRAGNAEEVAAVIAFLASDAASFITGITLPVDGSRQNVCPR